MDKMMKEDYIGDTLLGSEPYSARWAAEYNTRNVVATQPINEAKESTMRSKAMLIIARKKWSNYAWKRVMKRFINCIEIQWNR